MTILQSYSLSSEKCFKEGSTEEKNSNVTINCSNRACSNSSNRPGPIWQFHYENSKSWHSSSAEQGKTFFIFNRSKNDRCQIGVTSFE